MWGVLYFIFIFIFLCLNNSKQGGKITSSDANEQLFNFKRDSYFAAVFFVALLLNFENSVAGEGNNEGSRRLKI